MLTINLYKIRKRENSTKTPSTADGLFPVSGLLIENCGILYPRIRIAWSHEENPSAYNYAWVEEFNRYYWVKEWTWSENSWIGEFTVDPLASWKTEIGNSSQYVLRSSAQSDGALVDTYYNTRAQTSIVYTDATPAEGSAAFQRFYNQGIYVIGVIGQASGNAIGAVSYYFLTPLQMYTFLAAMLNTIDWTETPAEDLSKAMQKLIFNPFDYLVSCMWFPISEVPGGTGTFVPNIPFGWWTLNNVGGAQALNQNMGTFTYVYKCNVPKHPKAATRGSYLNLAPFSRYAMWASPCGTIPLDTTILQGRAELRIEKTIDLITGQGLVNIGVEDPNGNTMQIALRPCQIGVPIQVAQITADYLSAGLSLLDAGKGILTKGASLPSGKSLSQIGDMAIAGAVGFSAKGLSGIGEAVEASLAQVSGNGTNGSTVAYQYVDHLIAYFTDVADDDNENLGRPLCKVKTLNTIPGYIMCNEPDISCAATADEQAAIKSYLSQGFFYE